MSTSVELYSLIEEMSTVEKFGFRHDHAVMAGHGGNHARCDAAMSYPLALKATE
jgi:hypothetical protein